jgi:hypothetical protein
LSANILKILGVFAENQIFLLHKPYLLSQIPNDQ